MAFRSCHGALAIPLELGDHLGVALMLRLISSATALCSSAARGVWLMDR